MVIRLQFQIKWMEVAASQILFRICSTQCTTSPGFRSMCLVQQVEMLVDITSTCVERVQSHNVAGVDFPHLATMYFSKGYHCKHFECNLEYALFFLTWSIKWFENLNEKVFAIGIMYSAHSWPNFWQMFASICFTQLVCLFLVTTFEEGGPVSDPWCGQKRIETDDEFLGHHTCYWIPARRWMGTAPLKLNSSTRTKKYKA